MQPKLIGLRAPILGLTVDLVEAETTLGREAGNSIVLNSSSVSRRHARVIRQGSGFAIEDLGSANGVRVNGIPTVGATPLKNGDRIDLGEVSLMFDDPAATPAVSTAVYGGDPVIAGSTGSAGIGGRRPEVGSAERAAGYIPPSADQISGCNPLGGALNDLSGMLPGIIRYLIPALIGLFLLFLLFALVMAGVNAVQGLTHGGGGSGGGQTQGSSTGQNPPAGQNPPPAQNSSESGSGSAAPKISILSVRVIRAGGAKATLLVKWRNDSDQPVAELDGTVILHMPDGHQDSFPNTVLYKGAAIAPGATHDDTGTNDGAPLSSDADPNPAVLPTDAK